ncbi:hypothetical protein ACTQ49_14145 [Luteococcus sp. Sow4_B9]|uniref:hypothetical protein n=1 Tax=Luteococcus sp. Sow4_B9 TaxID=3438792 RepID=UPI003F98B383
MTPIEQRSIPADGTDRRLAVPAMVGIEMWERFSFYGMQAILAYYLSTRWVTAGWAWNGPRRRH